MIARILVGDRVKGRRVYEVTSHLHVNSNEQLIDRGR